MNSQTDIPANIQASKRQITGSITIYEVKELEIAFTLSDGVNVEETWDLKGVEEVDTCGIQWLASVRARLRDKGGSLRLINVSEELSEKIRLLGLSYLLIPNGEANNHV
ncbi:STAS domain-containing protein [Salinivibrio sharmensis]|uniref:STAS domain-containing protein n=1 Tax=Salinivibrio sharmensis TaxID=390883 RepID=A0ABX3KIH5_9GAMM|nr:STAS domain-containing protein [Salinivibrio sharmensis]OOE88999.1 hypothetical protein BZG74_07070 [Salinivibrio sharmensis]